MSTALRYRLKLSRLDFISPVDEPAQETAKVVLLKRGKKGDEIQAQARVVKMSDELGLVFCWAFTSTDKTGADYFDLQGDNVDQDFVKAAAEFMLGGGPTDEMHDSQPDGRVVFAMPMTPEIAKAFGVVSKTVGLMIALKPSPEVYAKYKAGEYTGVSIAGLGIREAIKAARKRRALRKELAGLAVTSVSDGHQHTVDPDDADDDGSGYTSFATTPSEEYGHTHQWVTDETGKISILTNEGHTHTVDAQVTPDNGRDLDTDTNVELVPVDGIGAGPGAISARARAADLRSASSGHSVGAMTELETLKVELAKANQRATLTDAQRAHLARLVGNDADAFLAKGHDARNAEITARTLADPEVYKSKVTGRVFRASDDPMAVEMAKRLDAQDEELAKMRSERNDVTFLKSAGEVLSFTKQDTALDIVKAIYAYAATEPAKQGAMLDALKQLTAMAKIAGTAQGIAGAPEMFVGTHLGTTPASEFEAARDAFAKAKGLPLTTAVEKAKATREFIHTSDGAQALRKYDNTKPSIAVAVA